VRLSADGTGVSWLTLRAVYEHAKRVGSGLGDSLGFDVVPREAVSLGLSYEYEK
jgi:hypothetical protein